MLGSLSSLTGGGGLSGGTAGPATSGNGDMISSMFSGQTAFGGSGVNVPGGFDATKIGLMLLAGFGLWALSR